MMTENELDGRQMPTNSSSIDDYTREVTEGVYTFDGTSKNVDKKKSQAQSILKTLVAMLVVCGFAIGALAGSSIAVLLLDQCNTVFLFKK